MKRSQVALVYASGLLKYVVFEVAALKQREKKERKKKQFPNGEQRTSVLSYSVASSDEAIIVLSNRQKS